MRKPRTPSTKVRSATYHASWLLGADPSLLTALVSADITHDWRTTKARFVMNGLFRLHEDGMAAAKLLDPQLAPFGLGINPLLPLLGEEKWRFEILPWHDTDLRFASSQTAVGYINYIAAILNNPPASQVTMSVQREVVDGRLNNGKPDWQDEGSWLARSCAYSFAEGLLTQAFNSFLKEGDVVRVTLKASPDVRGAERILSGYGIAFLLSMQDRVKLRQACAMGKIPDDFTVALEWRTPMTAGKTALAKSLAPFVSHITTSKFA